MPEPEKKDPKDETPASESAEGTTTEEKPAVEEKLGEAGERALKAERDARKAAEKRAREVEARLKAREDAEKSDSEKAADALKSATERAAAAERKLAAKDAGLPDEFADRLRGDTAEELAADAAALKAALKIEDKPAEESKPPAGSLGGGAKPPKPNRSLDEQIVEAERAGDWSKLDALNATKLTALAAEQAA